MQTSGTLRSHFHTATRQWRVFQRMKDHGFQSYSELLSMGAVEECPVCPHPGINLPPNWKHRENA